MDKKDIFCDIVNCKCDKNFINIKNLKFTDK